MACGQVVRYEASQRFLREGDAMASRAGEGAAFDDKFFDLIRSVGG